MNPLDQLHAAAQTRSRTGRALVHLSVGRSPLRALASVRAPLPRLDREPTVSVVIPCFNYARYLRDSVHSALNQDGVEVEVIVVDDASTDDSVEVARGLKAEDPRVRLIEHPANRGPVETFNDGLADCTGEFVVRLDADDLLTPGALGRAVAVFDRFPDVGLVYGSPYHFTSQVAVPRSARRPGWTVWSGQEWLRLRCHLGVNCITSPEVVMRHEVLKHIGGQRELAQTHDMELWLRVAAVSDVAHLDGVYQALHRDHTQSRSAKMVDEIVDLEERRAAFDVLFERVGHLVDGQSAMRDDARLALAQEALRRARRAYERGKSDARPVGRYVEFALETSARVRHLRDWRIVQRHQQQPRPGLVRGVGLQTVAVGSRLRDEYRYLRWIRTGI